VGLGEAVKVEIEKAMKVEVEKAVDLVGLACLSRTRQVVEQTWPSFSERVEVKLVSQQ
jgi:hypothetical protein